MEVLKDNTLAWKEFVANNEKVIESVYKIIDINENYYNKSPFSIDEGYGFKIFLFKDTKKFVKFMIEEELFGKVVEFVDVVDEGSGWLCLSYLLSSDVGVVVYIKT